MKGLLLKVTVFPCGSPSSLHPPLSIHRTLPSAWGYPQWLHHLLERWMLTVEGAAGVYTGRCTISIRAVKSTVGSSVTMSGHICGFSLDPSACRALELHTPALLRNDSQDNILPSCNTQDFSRTLPSPASAWCVCEGPKSELTMFYRTLLYFCRLSCGLHPAAAAFFFFFQR